MDVTSIIYQLRSERQQIEEAILSLEGAGNLTAVRKAMGPTSADGRFGSIRPRRKAATGQLRLSKAPVKRDG